MKKGFILFCLSLFFLISQPSALTKAPIDVTTASINELLDAMEKGYLTSETLVNIYLERIEEYDSLFNSINQINEHAIEQAKIKDQERAENKAVGKLHGIPIIVKCNIDIYGIPTTAGTKALIDNYPLENSTVVQKLIDEGAIILGSTNMSELAFSASNSYSSYGYVRNVFNTDYTSYGSSGGSAVSVAAAFAAASLGTDTNSSIRLPASGAGLVGIRPTYGLISSQGVIPYDYERDTVGILSRSVSDSALLLNIISEDNQNKMNLSNISNQESLEGVNIGILTQYVKGSSKESGVTGLTDPDIYSLVEESIAKLEELGANIIYLDNFVKSSNLTIATSTYAGITMCDYFNEYLKGTTGSIRSFKELANSKGHVQSLSGYVAGCNQKYKSASSRESKKSVYRNYVDNYFEEYSLDAVLYPTLKNKVFEYNKTGTISPSSSFGSVIGYPSITVPMGFANDGFSYNIEFLTTAYNEEKIYDIAIAFEKANNNKISTSKLTPSLYTIPNEVEYLKELYETAIAKSNQTKSTKDWIKSVKEFFLSYNSYEDESAPASILIEQYENLNIINNIQEIEPTKIKLLLIPFLVLSTIIVCKNIPLIFKMSN